MKDKKDCACAQKAKSWGWGFEVKTVKGESEGMNLKTSNCETTLHIISKTELAEKDLGMIHIRCADCGKNLHITAKPNDPRTLLVAVCKCKIGRLIEEIKDF